MHRTLSVSICLSQRPHIGRFPFLITPTIAGLGHTEESPTGRARSGATAYRGGAAGHRAAGGRAGGRISGFAARRRGFFSALGVRARHRPLRCSGGDGAASRLLDPRSRRRRHGDGRGLARPPCSPRAER